MPELAAGASAPSSSTGPFDAGAAPTGVWSNAIPKDQENFPQQIGFDPATGDLYLTQAERLSDNDNFETLTISRFTRSIDTSSGKITFTFKAKMHGLRGPGSPFRVERKNDKLFLTFGYQEIKWPKEPPRPETQVKFVRLPFEARAWKKAEILDAKYKTGDLDGYPPQPPPKWTQGEVDYQQKVVFRLVGGPYDGPNPTKPDQQITPSELYVIRNGAIVGKALDLSMLGREGMETKGRPFNGRLEPEGLAITEVGGVPHLIVGIANGGAKNLLLTLYAYLLEWARPGKPTGVPKAMRVGETATVTITMLNAGESTWIPGQHFLSSVPPGSTTWGPDRHALTASVDPGDPATFTFTITAPPPTNASFQWRMARAHNGNLTPFGQTTPTTTIKVSLPPEPIRLTKLSPSATWAGAQLVDDGGNTRNGVTLPFNGNDGDDRGFVRLTQLILEDGRLAEVLETHPMWVPQGTIKGWHPEIKLPPGATLRALVGFRSGAFATDGVRFRIFEHHNEPDGRRVWNRVLDVHKTYTGALAAVSVDLTHLAGQLVGIELRVDAGPTSTQDWAVWLNPTITGN